MRKGKFNLEIKAVRPTIFFIRKGDELQQMVVLSVKNNTKPVIGKIEVRFDSKKYICYSGKINSGEKCYNVYVPDIRGPIPVRFVVSVRGKEQTSYQLNWQVKKRWRVYLVHTSHHDVGYTDLPANVLKQHTKFLDDVINFCGLTKKFPNESKFRYTVEQSWSVIHYLENRPSQSIKKLVRLMKQGRIEITALFGNLITELCDSEELIRSMYPSFYLKQKYGIPIDVAELNDIPGFSWGLASALANAGVRYFAPAIPGYFGELRFIWDEGKVFPRGLPGAFWWEGQDGSRVLVWYKGEKFWAWYWRSYQHAYAELPAELEKLDKQNYPYDIVCQRFLGARQDNSPPAVELSYIVKEWNSRWAYPKLIVSTYRDFFKQLEEQYGQDLRVLRGELPNTDYTIGALSTAHETGVNRVTHDQLNSAEKFATIASQISDYRYPQGIIDEAYRNMILYDEHTWGMSRPVGPAQDAHWSMKSGFAYRASALAQDILSKSLNKIADGITCDDNYHIIVFNPLSWKRTDVVRVLWVPFFPCGRSLFLSKDKFPMLVSGFAIDRDIITLPSNLIDKSFELIDLETGRKVPYQIIKLDTHQAVEHYSAYRYALGQINPSMLWEIVFIAEDVPALGYKTYKINVVNTYKGENICSPAFLRKKVRLENKFFRIDIDKNTGVISSIYDKETLREIVDKHASHKFNQFIIRSAKTGEEKTNKILSIEKSQEGPIYKSIIIKSTAEGCPQITQEIITYDNLKRIDLNVRILKDSTPFQEIYLAFPFSVEKPKFRFEGTNCVIRPLIDQFPGSNTDYYAIQHWVNVFDEKIGIIFSSLESPVAEFGGLWPGYVSPAHHGIPPPGFDHEFLKRGDLRKGYIYSYLMNNNFRTNFQPIQVGDNVFRYCITTYQKKSLGDVQKFGWEVHNSFIPVVIKGNRKGALPHSCSFISLGQPNVMLMTLKRAQNGIGLIIRVKEIGGKRVKLTITFPYWKIKDAYQTNLVEEDQKKLPISEHSVRLTIGPFNLANIRLII